MFHSRLYWSLSLPLRVGVLCLLVVWWLESSTDIRLVFQSSPPEQESQIRTVSKTLTSKLMGANATPETLPPANSTESVITSKLGLFSANSTNARHILSLGGSVTWGSMLESRLETYPHVLAGKLGPEWAVTNLAIRATGAWYASKCIESMIRQDAKVKPGIAADPDFDLILVEYSLNGLQGIHLLVSRLRRRYPRAVFMYIHLWSLRAMVQNTQTKEVWSDIWQRLSNPKDREEAMAKMMQDPATSWIEKSIARSDSLGIEASDLMTKIQGHMYKMQRPLYPQKAFEASWFAKDYHHLSAKGHAIVASDLYALLERPDVLSVPVSNLQVQVPSWGQGDQCHSWYETGNTGLVTIRGGNISAFIPPDKWALHIGQDEGGKNYGENTTLEFLNNSKRSQPVDLLHMAKGDPSVYPKSTILLKNANGITNISLDPLHPIKTARIHHVTHPIRLGQASPGMNTIKVIPDEITEQPLRVTGIIMCAECAEWEKLSKKVHKGTDNTTVPP